jgi:hypothetical protein
MSNPPTFECGVCRRPVPEATRACTIRDEVVLVVCDSADCERCVLAGDVGGQTYLLSEVRASFPDVVVTSTGGLR